MQAGLYSAQCRRWYPANSPWRRQSIENAPLRRLGLFSPRFQERLPAPTVHRREPLFRIRNDWLQKNSLRNAPHAHHIALETKFARQPHSLAAPVAKQFRQSALGHGRLPYLIYIINLYPWARAVRTARDDVAGVYFGAWHKT